MSVEHLSTLRCDDCGRPFDIGRVLPATHLRAVAVHQHGWMCNARDICKQCARVAVRKGNA